MLSKPIKFISKESDMNYAHIKTKTAWLWTEFGESYASRVFPEVVAELPVYVKGKKKGKIKDHRIEWEKVEKGGWVKVGEYQNGYVERRVGKVIKVSLIKSPWGCKDEVVAETEGGNKGKAHA